MGGIRWPGAVTVKYRVLAGDCTNDCGAAVAQVNLGFDEWEVSGVTFTQNNGSPDTNLCTDSPNLVEWALIDGPGGILAQVFVCRNPATKAILGFRIEFDSGDIWSDSGDGGKFDIRAVAAHEAGHATGLGHVNSPGASRLTMFNAIATGDPDRAMLGCGDRLGVNALYGTSLDCTELPDD
jgi:hypothetical protein